MNEVDERLIIKEIPDTFLELKNTIFNMVHNYVKDVVKPTGHDEVLIAVHRTLFSIRKYNHDSLPISNMVKSILNSVTSFKGKPQYEWRHLVDEIYNDLKGEEDKWTL